MTGSHGKSAIAKRIEEKFGESAGKTEYASKHAPIKLDDLRNQNYTTEAIKWVSIQMRSTIRISAHRSAGR